MDNEERDFFKKLLRDKRKEIVDIIEQLREMSQIKNNEDTDMPKNSFNAGEEGGDALDREQSFFMISRELRYLNQIDNALAAIDKGTYGICKVCGKDISRERLEAVPTTNVCVACKTSKPDSFSRN